MRKPVQIALGVLVIVVSIAIALALWPRHEPVYKGKTLSYWLQQYNEVQDHDKFGPIDEAIRAMGTNALPRVLSDLQRQEPVLWTTLARWSGRHRWIRLPVYGEDHYTGAALMALKASSSNATPILPALVSLLQDPKVEGNAELGLFLAGPAALTTLEKGCRSTNLIVRAQAAILMARIRTMPGIAYGFGWSKSPLNGKPVLYVGWAFLGNGEQQTLERIVEEVRNLDPGIRLANLDALRSIVGAPSNSPPGTVLGLFTGVNSDAVQTAKDTLNQLDREASANSGR
jgi:hypothetical protein